MKFRGKKILVYASALLGTIIIGGELFSRYILGLGSPPLSIRHPTIEYMFKPNQNLYRFGNHVVINEYGMRSESFPLSKEKDEIRVMIFGDSVINGGNLTDQKDLASEIIKRELNQKQQKVTVGNISAGSWGPGNWLAYAKQYGFFDAVFIILVTNSGDYADNPTFAPLDKNTHPTIQPISALVEGIERYLPRYLPESKSENNLQKNNQKLKDPSAEVEAAKKGIHDLSEFLELAKKQHKPIFVIQHLGKIEVNSNTFEPGYYAIRKVCVELGVKCISLEAAYKKVINNKIDIFHDKIHVNALGQRVIAEEILDKVFRLPKRAAPK